MSYTVVAKEWGRVKKELETSLQEVMDSKSQDKEVYGVMLEMLKNSKLKKRRDTKNE